jgi:cytochrome c-type biogenesis protein CcmF
MSPEIGTLLLYIALSLSLIMPILAISGRARFYRIMTFATFTATLLSFIILVYCFALSDFSVLLVANNSHTSKPIIYKISAAWGNHEGSMLMWVVCLSFFNFLYAEISKRNGFNIATVSVQSLVNALFIAFVLFLSNPFTRVFPAPINGLGFNPILQDIGRAMHPPTLYLGYVGFSICYSSAIAALITREDVRNWAVAVRPYLLLSWAFLTAGIGLGSWWAYRELGWGGYWFWDPVENASLVPWLCGAALIHSVAMVVKKKGLEHWSIILGILTFSLCVVGTFLVRSGLITSVHSFASDPSRGIAILSIICMLSIIGFMAYGMYAKNIKSTYYTEALVEPNAMISLNNLVLIFFATVVIVGTIYPMALELFTGEKISVGAPYYNAIIAPTSLLLVLLCALYPILINKVRKKNISWKLSVSLVFGLLVGYVLWSVLNWFYLIIIIASTYLLLDSASYLEKNKSMSLGHMGFAMLVIAISINSMSQFEVERTMKIGDKEEIVGMSVELKNIEYFKGPNYFSRQAQFGVYENKKLISTIKPETRLYPIEEQQTTESDIYHSLFYDLYITIGQAHKNETLDVRIYYRPAIFFIWLSCLLIFLAAIASILNIVTERLKLYGRRVPSSKSADK